MIRSKEETRMLLAKFDRDVEKYSYIMRLLISFDQFIGCVFFKKSQDETISSHIGRTGKAKWLCWILRKLEAKHCLKSRGE